MAPYKLSSPCVFEDRFGLARNNVSAFWEEDSWRLLWPGRSRESLIEAVAARFPKNLLSSRDVRRHQKVVDVASGEIVGYARWILPKSQQNKWLVAQAPEASGDERERFEELHAKADFNSRDDLDDLDEHIPALQQKYKHDECLVLDYLAVHPEHQRKGVARMLAQSGVDEAQKLGLDVFLVATSSRAPGMYQKAGFEILDHQSQSLAPYGSDQLYETFCMMRYAK